MAKISTVCDIEVLEAPVRPARKHEMSMYLCKQWFRLRWKQEILDKNTGEGVVFDANLLNERVLNEILGIKDVRSDQRVTYIEGSKGLKGIEKVCKPTKGRVGFVMYPVSFDELVHVADAGGTLPPKSTYFAPRLKSGILVQLLKKSL